MQTTHNRAPVFINSELSRSQQTLISERQEVIDFVEGISINCLFARLRRWMIFCDPHVSLYTAVLKIHPPCTRTKILINRGTLESIHNCFLPDKGVIKAEGLLNILNYAFDYRGGKEYLYVLFPDGLLSTSSGLVDLPNEKIQFHHKSAGTARSYNEQQLLPA